MTANPLRKIGIVSIFFGLVGIVAFATVTIIPQILVYGIASLSFLFSLVYFYRVGFVSKSLCAFLAFFLLPFFIGIIGLPLSFLSQIDRFNYYDLNIFGRIFNFIFISSIILFYDSFSRSRDVSKLFKFYMVGVLILLLTAVWQSLAVYFSLVPFPFDTRSHVHGASEAVNLGSRITGIAREPSFFVIFLVDFIGLTLLFKSGLKKIVYLALSFVLLVLSLSPSGFVTVGLAFSASYFFTQIKFYRELGVVRVLTFIVIIVSLFGAYLSLNDTPFFSYLVHRVVDVDPQKSDRLFMLIMPFEWVKDSGAFSLIFGHGIKAYSIVGSAYLLPDGSPVHATSNNMFVDVFWESGLLGLIFLLTFFASVFFKIMKSNFSRQQIFISLFVFFDLLGSSMFRADFASFRFFIMLYLLYILIKYDIQILKREK